MYAFESDDDDDDDEDEAMPIDIGPKELITIQGYLANVKKRNEKHIILSEVTLGTLGATMVASFVSECP